LFPGPTWCDIILRPAHFASSLSEEIIAWAVRECRGKNPQPSGPLVLRIGRRATSPERLEFLERLGFERMTFGYLALAVDAQAEGQRQQLPAGFVCRPLQQEDIPSRVATYHLVFRQPSIDGLATIVGRISNPSGWRRTDWKSVLQRLSIEG
jgi:hypothetical protein